MLRFLLPTLILPMVFPSIADAQQYKQPWRFGLHNRAQLAIAMRQIEDSSSGGGGSSVAAATTIVCGGGSATATANNTCIILNNSTGEVMTEQDSLGDQNASNVTETTSNNSTDADEILSALSGSQ